MLRTDLDMDEINTFLATIDKIKKNIEEQEASLK